MIAGALQTFYNGMKEFADEFMAFVENPTLTNFKELFTGDSSKFLLGLAGIAALLNPLKALKLLRLGVTGLVAGFGALGRGLNRMSGPTDKQGRKLVKGKDFCEKTIAEVKNQITLLQKSAIQNENLFEKIMEATKVCSLGQITTALFEVGGQYRRNM